MTQAKVFPDWKAIVQFNESGPGRTPLLQSEGYMSVLIGLTEGQAIPPHPSAAATYHFLEGSGTMVVDDEQIKVGAGATVVVPQDSTRGISADTRLVFLASRGPEPADNPKVGKRRRLALIIGMLVLMGIMAGMMFAPAVLMASRAPSDLAMRGFMYLPLAGMVLMVGAMFFFFRKMGKRGHHHH